MILLSHQILCLDTLVSDVCRNLADVSRKSDSIEQTSLWVSLETAAYVIGVSECHQFPRG